MASCRSQNVDALVASFVSCSCYSRDAKSYSSVAHSPRVIARARLALSPFRIPRRRDLAELTAISATVLRKPGTCREIMIIHRPHQRLGT